MATVLTVVLAYYLGGVSVLLLNETGDTGDGIQFADVVSAVVWPVTAATLIYNKIAAYRKGS